MSSARDVPCPQCGAAVGVPCIGTVRNSHGARLGDWGRKKARTAGRAARMQRAVAERAARFTVRETEVLHAVLDHLLDDAAVNSWETIDVWHDGEWDGVGADIPELKRLRDKLRQLISRGK